MPDPSTWGRAEEYIREAISRITENQEKLEERLRDIQIEMAMLKARGYFGPSVIASIIAGTIILIFELVVRK